MNARRSIPATLCALLGALTIAATPAFATGDATTSPGESCPNETLVGFSPLLPDCRAFEQVTPVFKEAEAPTLKAISADGSHVLINSYGTFAGRENGGRFAGYLLGRGADGWAPFALSPPSSEFPAQEVAAATSDLSRTLWRLRAKTEPIAAEDLYLKDENGALTKIGSLVPPAYDHGPESGDTTQFFGQSFVHYQDASSDLSHVLFSVTKSGPLWPFDTTIPSGGGHTSLYEYVGTNVSQPALVGVSDGTTSLHGFRSNTSGTSTPESTTETLPAGRLISDCQTKLGSESEDGYNAMSSDGNTIYFTAAGFESIQHQAGEECAGEIREETLKSVSGYHAPAVSELYVRLNGSQTLPISEPTKQQCAACQEGEPAMPAEFVGASENGSKAFFITKQELLPGSTGMNLYEYDLSMPAKQHLLRVSSLASVDPKVLGVARVSSDGSHVYFVAESAALASNANAEGVTAQANEPNLYLFTRDAAHPQGELSYVATLSPEDSDDWALGDSNREVQATPDGRYLVFSSRAHLTAGDVAATPQLFEYDAVSGELVQVSAGEGGYANGESVTMPSTNLEASSGELGPTAPGTALALSDDGAVVVFETRGVLTKVAAEAVGNKGLGAAAINVYEFHSAGVLSLGTVGLLSASAQSVEGVDGSGQDVLFKTSLPLVSTDNDGGLDLYDARVEGGVPVAVAPSECSGEACQGAPSIAPSLGMPSPSSTVVGSGDLSPSAALQKPPPAKAKPKAEAKKCKRGTRRRRGKCVKRMTGKSTHRRGGK